MSDRYAARTTVSPEKSQAEIDATLKRYGCDQRMWGRDDTLHMVAIAFRRKGQGYRMQMPLPVSGYSMGAAKAEAETRRRFRVLLIWLKAQFEMVDTGLITFEDAFMPHAILPDGRTAAQAFAPQIAAMLESGRMPTLSLALPAGRDA